MTMPDLRKRNEALNEALSLSEAALATRIAEVERLREALTEIWQLDSPGQCAEIACKALEYDNRR